MRMKYIIISLFILQLLYIPSVLGAESITTNWTSYNEIGDINNCITGDNLLGIVLLGNHCHISYGTDVYVNQTITQNNDSFYLVSFSAVLGYEYSTNSYFRTRIYINNIEVVNTYDWSIESLNQTRNLFFPNGTYNISLRISYLESDVPNPYVESPENLYYVNIYNYTLYYPPDNFNITSWGNTYTDDETLKFYAPEKGTINFNLTLNKNITYADSTFYINGVPSYNYLESPYLYNFYSFDSGIYNITTVVNYNNTNLSKTWIVYYGLYPKISGYTFFKDLNNEINILPGATVNLNSSISTMSDENGYYIFSFEGDVYNPDYSKMPVVNTVYDISVYKNNSFNRLSERINYTDIFDIAYKNYTLTLLTNHAKITSNTDVINYFWDILFLACGLYIASFFVTIGDKR